MMKGAVIRDMIGYSSFRFKDLMFSIYYQNISGKHLEFPGKTSYFLILARNKVFLVLPVNSKILKPGTENRKSGSKKLK